MNDKNTLTRSCPSCYTLIEYKSISGWYNAIRINSQCKQCYYQSRIDKAARDKIQDLQEIKQLCIQGFTTLEISKIINLDTSTVSRRLKELGLKARQRNTIFKVSDTEAKCSVCDRILSLSFFQKGRIGTDKEYIYSFCNDCRNKKTKNGIAGDLERYLRLKFGIIKRRHNDHGLKPEFDLSLEYIIELYKFQEGYCLLSSKELAYGSGKGKLPNSICIDRLDNSIGYIRGNIAFICNKLNTIKSDLSLDEIKEYMPEWYRRIKEFKEAETQHTALSKII